MIRRKCFDGQPCQRDCGPGVRCWRDAALLLHARFGSLDPRSSPAASLTPDPMPQGAPEPPPRSARRPEGPTGAPDREAQVRALGASRAGFDGEVCGACGSVQTIRTGKCVLCLSCGHEGACG